MTPADACTGREAGLSGGAATPEHPTRFLHRQPARSRASRGRVHPRKQLVRLTRCGLALAEQDEQEAEIGWVVDPLEMMFEERRRQR